MTVGLRVAILVQLTLATAGCVARAQSAETSDAAVNTRVQHRAEYNAYLASISTTNAASSEVVALSNSDFAPLVASSSLESPCGVDEVLWHREPNVMFCTPLCGVDEDCLGIDERCIGPDYGLPSDGESVLWENVELSDGRIAYGLCDPFAELDATDEGF